MAAEMTIQIFLSVLLGGVAILVGLQRTTGRLVRVVVLGLIAVGCVFVWMPDRTTLIAHALGVNRGADLMLYLWVVITLALIVFLYLKLVIVDRKITQLTRALALAHARGPERPADAG